VELNGSSACLDKEISLVEDVKLSENKLWLSPEKSRAYFDVFPTAERDLTQ